MDVGVGRSGVGEEGTGVGEEGTGVGEGGAGTQKQLVNDADAIRSSASAAATAVALPVLFTETLDHF